MNVHAFPQPKDAPAYPEKTRHASELPLTMQWLGKSFGRNNVLRDINLHVPAGQFVAVIGRSGCGKSTLLRVLLGLDRQTSGTFWFGDDPKNGPDRYAVRVMFQEPRLLPWATVRENVEIGLGTRRGSPEARERALTRLREVGLEDRSGDWPSVLSGGQKQRVALARALVSNPRFLAFDEPLGALDALTRISMQRLLEKVWLAQGFTALMVTHDVAEAVTLADRVLMIEDGEIALDLRIDLSRPRQRGSAEVAALEGQILNELLHDREQKIPPDEGDVPHGFLLRSSSH
jgi:sulfonate transport system ATP-binding protein